MIMIILKKSEIINIQEQISFLSCKYLKKDYNIILGVVVTPSLSAVI